MFVLVEMVDTVRIPPWQFERKLNDSIAEELNKKLANKVVYNVGLCICLFDITKLEDAYVFPGDGASHTKGGYLLSLGHWASWGSVFCSQRSSQIQVQWCVPVRLRAEGSLEPQSSRPAWAT
uniref:DNA-directed RNA polymerase subunit n=1 Tax=Homo sapiens TaxID=9606 RepID=Q6ZPA8_HUMAN|nr:unnamed protein product [Homo sapiens]